MIVGCIRRKLPSLIPCCCSDLSLGHGESRLSLDNWPLLPTIPSRSVGCGATMSGRKLGGGRILGSGRSLSPAHPPRNSSLLSPSASTLSVNSSTSQPSTEPQDLGSRVSLDHSDDSTTAAAAAASSRLVCPICNEEMVGSILWMGVSCLWNPRSLYCS